MAGTIRAAFENTVGRTADLGEAATIPTCEQSVTHNQMISREWTVAVVAINLTAYNRSGDALEITAGQTSVQVDGVTILAREWDVTIVRVNTSDAPKTGTYKRSVDAISKRKRIKTET
mmetsp:Transcript_35896/g.70632  ORF Transcript_35896/g.70632 Transcript_35896/m.70632 type:complete len:118 (-) Transcript_35896:138-491(-)|eukprot:CAMPEP_0194327242 /NCGR_PEP_ID=MMETSP0171-20130528/40247_1 /TAXON_ID=218684 /ORGANISM="Corethron pennatum, Strain L29A3" /LENGTH=117 /DNA_ID=CAMNT_0039087127 /DNA_START=541 /DNA_END=894 /DNA_ORIENTATION=-